MSSARRATALTTALTTGPLVAVLLGGCTGEAAAGSPPGAAGPTSGTAAGSPSAPAADFRTYSNQRYGFQAQVPTALQATSSPDGAGMTFRSADGQIEETASASPTPAGASAASEERRVEADLRHRGQVTYTHVDPAGAFTVSGYLYGGRTVDHVHEVVGPHTEYLLSWSFPTARRDTVEPWVDHSVATFRPGPL